MTKSKLAVFVFLFLLLVNILFITQRNSAFLGVDRSADVAQTYAPEKVANWIRKDFKMRKTDEFIISLTLKSDQLLTSELAHLKHINKVFNDGFKDRYGPPADTSSTSLISLFLRMRQGETNLYCDDLSNIYGLFAQKLGLNFRQIDITKREGGKMVSQHVLIELWLPKLQQWVVADPSLGAGLFKNRGGGYLTAVELYEAALNDELQDLTILKNGAFQPLSSPDNNFIKNYYNTNTALAFVDPTWFSKRGLVDEIKNYFTSKTYFTFYGENFTSKTLPIFAKPAVFILLFFSFVVALLHFIKFLKRN